MSSKNDMDTTNVSAEELEILAYLVKQERQSQLTAQRQGAGHLDLGVKS